MFFLAVRDVLIKAVFLFEGLGGSLLIGALKGSSQGAIVMMVSVVVHGDPTAATIIIRVGYFC
jgi:hypothetical protein